MNTLTIDIDTISQYALEMTQAVLAKNDESKMFENAEAGPLVLASALSDFFQIAGSVDNGMNTLQEDEIGEFAEYGLDLLDRLAYFGRQLEVMDQRENQSKLYASIGVWLARKNATIGNLEGIADGFGWIVNGLKEKDDLAEMCGLMEEVIQTASEELEMDEDKSNPFRPWRVLNLNSGIAATRALNADLMKETFEKLGRRLPYDIGGFLADGKRQMAVQNIPDDVREVMEEYSKKWSVLKPPLH